MQNYQYSRDFYSIVALGSFNPLIVQPEWLWKNKIIDHQEFEIVRVKVITQEYSEIEFGQIRVVIFDNRLVVETGDASKAERILDFLKIFLKVLSHTPIKALGINHNIIFSINSLEYWDRIGHALVPKEDVWSKFLNRPGMAEVIVRGVVDQFVGAQENVTVKPVVTKETPHGLEVASNLHLPVETDPGTSSANIAITLLETYWKRADSLPNEASRILFDVIK